MKVGLIGRSELLFNCYELLHSNGYEIAFILTAKEAPEYLKTSKDFEQLAKSINVGYLCTPSIGSPESIEFIKSCQVADICISVNYSGVIGQEVIDLFPLGILNAHGGDLPRYRGNACQAWALVNGESRIGLCVHRMIGGELDSGDIIARKYLSIDINTRIGECYSWMEAEIPPLFLEAINNLSSDEQYVLEIQSKNPRHAMRCYPRCPDDGRINWDQSSIEILRLINASSEPFSGAYCFLNEEKFFIWRAELIDDSEIYCAVPGQIAYIDKIKNEIVVITGEGKLKLTQVSRVDNIRIPPTKIVKSIRNRLT